MSTKAITEKPEPDELQLGSTLRETAPSMLQADVPTVARGIGFAGLLCYVLGAVAIGFEVAGHQRYIGAGFGTFLAFIGLGGLLYHATRETDAGLRRLYLLVGAGASLALAVALGLYPAEIGTAMVPQTAMGGRFLPLGLVALLQALLFTLTAMRGEDDPGWRRMATMLLGGVGLAVAGIGLVGGSISVKFLLPLGLLLAVVGLAYLWAFLVAAGTDTDLAHRVALLVGVIGVIVLVVAGGRGLLTRYGWFGIARDAGYLTSAGIPLMFVGLMYAILALTVTSDRPTVVLFRRELGGLFYSPMAYFVLFGFAFMAWCSYYTFLDDVIAAARNRSAMVEPIIWPLIWGIIPVICFVASVPLLTMGLMSEEERSGTLEMLLTVPIEETPVVLSKFFAVLVLFILTWLPFGAYLIALRMVGEQPFDYRPAISFFIALVCSSAGYLSMGLFFSSLTRNQLVAGVLTFAAMVVMTVVFFLRQRITWGAEFQSALMYLSYIDLWRTTLQGKLALGDLVFHVGITVFWLFLTVKVLESRKWR